jgi:hypothetical protein
MKKDYNFYYKRGTIYAILSLVIMLIVIVFAPILFGLHIMSWLLIGFAFVAIGFYILSIWNRNICADIVIGQKKQMKNKAIGEIIQLIRNGKTKEAIDALYDYGNKYN